MNTLAEDTIEDFTEAQIRGATSLVKDGLALSRGHTLLLIYQDSLADAARCIGDVCERLGINVTAQHFVRRDFFGAAPPVF